MSRTRSLEEERNEILLRIHLSREEYRGLLASDTKAKARTQRLRHAARHAVDVPAVDVADLIVAPGAGQHPAPNSLAERRMRISDPAHPAQAALGWVKAHPLLCIATVATVAAIGPRRVMRLGIKGAGALATLTFRNPRNVDSLNQLLSSVAGYLQRERIR